MHLDLLEDTLARPVLRGALWVARFLWWLAWDLCVETVGWSIGWPICRVLTFGRFPKASFGRMEDASVPAWAGVEAVGLATLAGIIGVLVRLLHH